MVHKSHRWRLFVDPGALSEGIVELAEAEHHFAHSVLRLGPGESVEISDGRGALGQGEISKCDKKGTQLIVSHVAWQRPPELGIHLFIGLPKPSAVEETISLAAEIGCTSLHLIRTEKCQNKGQLRLDRLERLALEALRINKSVYAMSIHHHLSLTEFARSTARNTVDFLCDESPLYETQDLEASCSLSNGLLSHLSERLSPKAFSVQTEQPKPMAGIGFFVGPEASFTSDERKYLCEELRAVPVTLGSRILRVPTAAVYALSVAMAYLQTIPMSQRPLPDQNDPK